MSITHPTTTDDDVFTKQEALDLEREGKAALKAMVAGGYQFFVVLAKLQIGGAHVLRGFPNFGDYAADRFDDVEAENAKKMVKTGTTLLKLLDAHKLGKLEDAPKVIGTTGVRALSAIDTKRSTEFMLRVFDAAKIKADELKKPITGDIVKACMLELEPPQVVDALPQTAGEADAEIEDDDPGVVPEHGQLTSQFLDKVADVQQMLSDLTDEIDNFDTAKAEISMERVTERFADLPQAFDLVTDEQNGNIIYAEEPVGDGEERCKKCGEVKQLDADHFPLTKKGAIDRRRMHGWCLVCASKPDPTTRPAARRAARKAAKEATDGQPVL